jgi:hypothetical protein
LSAAPLSALANMYAVPQAIGRPLTPAQVALLPVGYTTDVKSMGLPGTMGPDAIDGYTPAQIRQAYGISQLSETGAGQTIAIVDAYDLSTATITADLNTFDAQFGVQAVNGTNQPTFTVETQTGATLNEGWSLEIALDVEWAHAVAPMANILLVQAASSSFANMLAAVNTAATTPGVSVVSMSWGGGEFSGEAAYNSYFETPGVSFVASSGDTGGEVEFPAVVPYVTGVGGTTLTLNGSGGYGSESAWSGGGGGLSTQISEPAYQSGFLTSAYRGVPDVAFDASPNSGVAVFESGWQDVGGTSVGAPQWSGLFALANQGRVAAGKSTLGITTTDPYGVNTALYQLAGGTSYTNPNDDFNDITTGSNGNPATAGYDLATGLGSPVVNNLIPGLIGTLPPPTIGDPDFSEASVGAGNYVSDPTGSAWTFSGAGVSGNDSPFTSGNPNAPVGSQVAFLQNLDSITQSVAGWAAGSYTISFDAAARGNWGGLNNFEVLIDGTVVGTFEPTTTSYQIYTTNAFTVASGTHTIEFLGLNTAGGDDTDFLDNVTDALASPPAVPTIGDSGFETVAVGNGFAIDPTGSAWTFSGVAGNGSGVAGNNSPFTSGNPNAPQGTQVGYLQSTGTITQSVAGWAAGSYTISFDAAARGNWGGLNNFEVLIDGIVVGTFEPTTTSYQIYTTNVFTVASGTHTIEFLGLNTAGGDDTDFLDNVTVA